MDEQDSVRPASETAAEQPIRNGGQDTEHHRHHHHHADGAGEQSGAGRGKKTEFAPGKKKASRKKPDWLMRTLEVWLLLLTAAAALTFLIVSENPLVFPGGQSADKWGVAAAALGFAGVGGLLYLLRDRILSRGTGDNVKDALKALCCLLSAVGLALLLAVGILTASAAAQPLDRDDMPVTRGELDDYLAQYFVKNADSQSSSILPKTEGEISLANDALQLCMDDPDRSVDEIVSARRQQGRLDVEIPATLRFSVDDAIADYVRCITVEVSEDEEFTQPRIFFLGALDREVDVYHLKTGTQYHYRVSTTLTVGDSVSILSARGSFRTADSPRILSIGGLKNVRDIGGLTTADGLVIRQGLLIRGSELDGAVEPDYLLTAEGRADMLEVLGVRTDLDLREYHSQEPLGVPRISFSAPQYGDIFTEDGKQTVGSVFRALAEPENYPVYLHCTYGLDRTGTVCFLLETLLGVSPQDAVREYEYSALFHDAVSGEALNAVTDGLRAYDGADLQEQTEQYLLSCGVTGEQLSSLRDIFLAEK